MSSFDEFMQGWWKRNMVDINEKTFGQLINEDIGWLIESTKECLERQHIIAVLENALRQYCQEH